MLGVGDAFAEAVVPALRTEGTFPDGFAETTFSLRPGVQQGEVPPSSGFVTKMDIY